MTDSNVADFTNGATNLEQSSPSGAGTGQVKPSGPLQLFPEPDPENPLWKYYLNNQGRIIHKWPHYFDIYHNHFRRYRNTNVTMLEIGLFKGGSLELWKNYFGPHARIFGMDIDPECLRYQDSQVKVFIGDQADRDFLAMVRKEIGRADIVLDDGGHAMNQQIASFEVLFDMVAEDGVYMVEDIHTSYWDQYDGGYRRPGTFVEYSKDLIDKLNAWHSHDPALAPDSFTRSVGGLHFYDSVLAIEKVRRPQAPVNTTRGTPVV